MRNMSHLLAGVLIGLLCVSAFGQGKTLNKSFSAKNALRISAVSGDFTIKSGRSGSVLVALQYDVHPEDAFKPQIREQGSTLRIKEIWQGNSQGEVQWTLTVPADVKIDFSSASGDISLEGSSGSVKISTASGDVTIENADGNFKVSTASGEVILSSVKGDFDISTASGDIDATGINGTVDFSTASGDQDLVDAKGTFELSCASGTIDVDGVIIEEASDFSTASGKVDITLSEISRYDLDLSSASGNAILNYNGKPFKGMYVLTARKDRGRIICSAAFDKEEEFERNNKTYMKKIFSKGGESPEIRISTSSGKAILK